MTVLATGSLIHISVNEFTPAMRTTIVMHEVMHRYYHAVMSDRKLENRLDNLDQESFDVFLTQYLIKNANFNSMHHNEVSCFIEMLFNIGLDMEDVIETYSYFSMKKVAWALTHREMAEEA